MARIPEDEEREERIHMAIIVDAYGPEEQAIGWYSYLQEHLHFSFVTTCVARHATSPLRVGDEVEALLSTRCTPNAPPKGRSSNGGC